MATAHKKNNSWHVYIRIRQEDGTQKKLHITGKTKREAEERAIEAQKHPQIKKSSVTMYEACEAYIGDRTATLSQSTIRGYESIVRNRLDGIGSLSIDDITSERLQRHINKLAKTLSAKSVKNTAEFLSSVLLIYRPDLRLRLSLPARRKISTYIPTEEDIAKLIEASKGTEAELPIILAAYGSLRRGEVAGLCVDCIHDNGIEVRRAYRQAGNAEWILSDVPKTYGSYRYVPLPEEVIGKLRQKCEGKEETDTVLNLMPYQVYERFVQALEQAGLPRFKFHALRHFFATFLHSRNVPDQDIAKLGGWEDVATLQRIYQHSTDTSVNAASRLLMDQITDLMQDKK